MSNSDTYSSARQGPGITRRGLAALLSVALMAGSVSVAFAQQQAAPMATETSDEALVELLPGFQNGYADVNGVRLHYVAGGEGKPLILLPGWPQTWWEFSKIMPELAQHYHVIAVDMRGMGASSKPGSGYDKKTMAADIDALVRQLGYDKVNIAGHDIGSHVAFSFAANYPASTIKVAMLDAPHPDDTWNEIRMLPAPGSFGEKADAEHPFYAWWFAFNQVNNLPEQLLAGKAGLLTNWVFDYLTADSASIDPLSRAVYADAYSAPGALAGGAGWYQAFPQDIVDARTYGKLQMPVLVLASAAFGWMQAVLPAKADDVTFVEVKQSGHYIIEEQPDFVVKNLISFFN